MHIEEEADFIGKMSDEELDEQELTDEILRDMERLLREGQQEGGDERSRRICAKL